MEEEATENAEGWIGLLIQMWNDGGPTVLMLVFLCFVLWNFIWKVWSAALKSKDDEIERLITEKNKYQNLVFERLLSSRVKIKTDQEKEKTEGDK